jgi:asparagine synthase (glutamine-hydrolysing)
LSVPVRRRLPGWRLKGLLRDTMAPSLPAPIVAAPKRGFTIPLAEWFQGDLRSFAAEILLDGETDGRGFLDRAAVEGMLQRPLGSVESGTVLWSLMMLELWRRESRPSTAGAPAVAGVR